MDDPTIQGLQVELLGDEGEKLRVYDDATGKPIGPGSHVIGNPTIGVGRNLSSRGILPAESRYMLSNDIAQMTADMTAIMPWVAALSSGRQIAVYSLYFNTCLGNVTHFEQKWPLFTAQMKTGQFMAAGDNLEHSHPWCEQVGPRAKRLANLVRYG